jgi:lipoprotein NlpD
MYSKRLPLFITVVLFCAVAAGSAELTHTVEKGQTVYSIARRYHVPVSLLLEENDIQDPSKLSVGTALVIPQIYRVERGDTYYSIAHEHGISVDRLLEANDRTRGDVLRYDETLFIPASGSGSGDGANNVARNSGSGTDSGSAGQAGSDGDEGRSTRSTSRDASSRSGAQEFPTVARTVRPEGGRAGAEWPVSGQRSQRSGKFPGVMIRGDRGASVVAVSSGRVVYAGPHTAFGKVVFVQSSLGYIYVYAGQKELRVNVGDRVTAGMEIGNLGSAPAADGPSLYFSVWKNDRFVDPASAPRG